MSKRKSKYTLPMKIYTSLFAIQNNYMIFLFFLNEMYAGDGAFTYTLRDSTITPGSAVFDLAPINPVPARDKTMH